MKMSSCRNQIADSACIVTHVFATGPAQELEDYLKDKVGSLFFIGHPFSFRPDTRSFYKSYHKGSLIKEYSAAKFSLPEIFVYLKDFLYTIFWVLKYTKKPDLYIGFDPLNALAGLFLKKIGKVEKVIFYTIDYVPERFQNKILNHIYHKIDIFCAEKSDFVWNLSQRIDDARNNAGMRKNCHAKVVPIGVNFKRIKKPDERLIERKCLAYMGFLDKKRGLELIIDSLPEIVQKNSDVKLMIIGGGSAKEYYRQMINERNLTDYVDFKGYIKDHHEAEALLTKCALGLAIYEPFDGNFTWYTDPSKPKQYMACGLPVVITGKPEIADEIKKRELGLAIDYKKDDFVDAITLLLNDDKLYFKCRKNAIEFAAGLEWSAIFERAFKDACS